MILAILALPLALGLLVDALAPSMAEIPEVGAA